MSIQHIDLTDDVRGLNGYEAASTPSTNPQAGRRQRSAEPSSYFRQPRFAPRGSKHKHITLGRKLAANGTLGSLKIPRSAKRGIVGASDGTLFESEVRKMR